MMYLLLIFASLTYLGYYMAYMISLEKVTKAQELMQEELIKMTKDTQEEIEELRGDREVHLKAVQSLEQYTKEVL